jgi:uncharacterized protein (TIGR02453 family)
MAFTGWPAEAIEFYEGLEADNSKVYWTEHKATYDNAVKAPMEALLEELAKEFGDGKIFRPFRDVRFSQDKSPYKTNCGARVGDAGYVSIATDGLTVGSGLFMPETAQLHRYRTAVDKDETGQELVEIVKRLNKAGYETMARDVLKTAPKGIDKDHPRIELLRYKGIAVMKTWPVGAWLGTDEAKTRVVTALRDARPLNEWLARNVG